jgi:hypothetical protein
MSCANLPEDAEVVVIDSDDLDEEERARLHATLERTDDELRTGKGTRGSDV